MTFSCTKKVLDRIGKYHPIDETRQETGFYNWYVDQINLERKNYFLFTNSETLFSFFIYAGTKLELADIEDLFKQKLAEQIIREISSAPELIEKALGPQSGCTFHKTNSRSLLGSMNELKYLIWAHLEREELEYKYDFINHALNKCPMSALKYEYPQDVMREKLVT